MHDNRTQMSNIKIHIRFFIFAFCFYTFSCGNGDVSIKDIDITNADIVLSVYTDSISLTWNSLDGAKKYEVRYATDENFTDVISIESNDEKVVITGLLSSTTYYTSLRAYNGLEWTEWTTTKEIKTALFSITIATYNILGIKYVDKSPWSDRKASVGKIILQENNFPDILGVQECENETQKNDMVDMLKNKYSYHVSDLAISPRIVFWKPEKYNLVETETIDLLPGKYPNMYSTQRYAHYVRLKEKITRNEVLIYNVHLRSGSDIETQALRKEKAERLCKIASDKSLELGNIPVIVMGDMNNYTETVVGGVPPSPKVFESKGFIDTFFCTDNRTNEDYKTYNTQENIDNCTVSIGLNGSKRLDYIFFYPKSKVSVSDYAIILNFVSGSSSIVECPIPSDHNPVRSTLHLFY